MVAAARCCKPRTNPTTTAAHAHSSLLRWRPLLRCARQAKLDDALKEAAVARALADSWQRDLKQTSAKVQAEVQRATSLAAQLEAAKTTAANTQLEAVRGNAGAEHQVIALKAQVRVLPQGGRRAGLGLRGAAGA